MLIGYYGLELDIPRWARYVATDEDGTVVAFEKRPTHKLNNYWDVSYRGGRFKELGKYTIIDKTDNWWSHSLEEVEYAATFEESSDLTDLKNDILDVNKMAWQHIVKVCCYKNNIHVVDAQRDLFKHIDDIVKSLKRVESLLQKSKILTRKLNQNGRGEIFELLTSETESRIRQQSLESLVDEYLSFDKYTPQKKKYSEVSNSVNAVYSQVCKSFYYKERMSLKTFRNILEEAYVFQPHELTEIFKGKEHFYDN